MLFTAGGMLPRCTGIAIPWATVSPAMSNSATEQSAPSFTLGEDAHLTRVDSMLSAIASRR